MFTTYMAPTDTYAGHAKKMAPQVPKPSTPLLLDAV